MMTIPARHTIRATTFLGLAACAVPALAQSAGPPVPCRVAGLDVLCATVAVPENRTVRGGRTIGLRVVILPARAPANATRQALFYLVGGPGLAASTLADLVAASHSTTRSTHDIVLVDQRGSGGSNPLRCDLYGRTGDVATYLGDQFPIDAVRECTRRLGRTADLAQYTTANAADDLEAVRAALDIPRIDIDASAYGTRVAQQYLARYASRVRTVVLQGPIPREASLPRSAARDAQGALDKVFADCAADPFCRTSFPRLRTELTAVLTRLDREASSVRAAHPRAEDSVTVRLTRGVFADRLRIMLYSTRLSRRIPTVIHRAHEGDWSPFVAVAYELSRVVFDQLDVGAHLSAACTEDLRPSSEDRATFLGDYRLRMYREACAAWPRASGADTGPVSSAPVPALLIVGGLDPVTPPSFAEAVARGLPNSTVVVVPGMAHAGTEKCLEEIVSAFVRQGSMRGVDTTCVKTIKPPPFITR